MITFLVLLNGGTWFGIGFQVKLKRTQPKTGGSPYFDTSPSAFGGEAPSRLVQPTKERPLGLCLPGSGFLTPFCPTISAWNPKGGPFPKRIVLHKWWCLG